MEAFSERWRRRGSESRNDRRADRRKRRRMLIAGGGAAAVVIAVAVYFLTGGGGNSANLGLNNLVTTFLPGELQQVPNTCTSVPSSMLGQYLPGHLKTAAPPLNTGANSQCTWTLDKPPVYRVLDASYTDLAPLPGLCARRGRWLVHFSTCEVYGRLALDADGQPATAMNEEASATAVATA